MPKVRSVLHPRTGLTSSVHYVKFDEVSVYGAVGLSLSALLVIGGCKVLSEILPSLGDVQWVFAGNDSVKLGGPCGSPWEPERFSLNHRSGVTAIAFVTPLITGQPSLDHARVFVVPRPVVYRWRTEGDIGAQARTSRLRLLRLLGEHFGPQSVSPDSPFGTTEGADYNSACTQCVWVGDGVAGGANFCPACKSVTMPQQSTENPAEEAGKGEEPGKE
jgi:hypothetical protein